MQKRRIGSLEVSVVGLGCNNFGWRIDEGQSAGVVNAALEAGINFFDTADIYGGGGKSEEFLGKALGARRREVILATKFGMLAGGKSAGAKAAYVVQAAEASLKRLNTDYIDLYQIHFPDPHTPIAETLGALEQLQRSGKVREIGCSNFSVEQLREAPAFVSVQNEYSLLNREAEREVLPECERRGIAFLPYFPLASGLLTGKYRRGQAAPEGSRIQPGGYFDNIYTETNLAKVEALTEFAKSRHRSLLEVAISWLLTRPAVSSVIAGATTPDQVRANTGAAGWRPATEDLTEISAIAGNS